MSFLLGEVCVLDLTRMLSGPYCSMLLADLGAQVIKVEELEGDPIRKMGPPFLPNGESAYFFSINRNKKSIAIDLKKQEGRDVFYKLVQKSDVVVDNFRPGVLQKLGCDYENLKKHNPKIISCSITSFGEEEPMRDLPAFDLIIQAYSGAMSITGEQNGKPIRMGIPLGDLAGGIYAAMSICAALVRRNSSNEGCCINISLLDALTAMLTYIAQYYFTDGKIPQPQGSRHMSCVPYGAFKTKDLYIVVGVFTEKFWEGFCKAIGYPELINDSRFLNNLSRVQNRNILEPILEKIFIEKSAHEWLERLQKEGVPCAPVNNIELVFKNEQILKRDMVVEIDHPFAGTLKTLGCPIKVEGSQKTIFTKAPSLGEHTREILISVAGISESEYNILRERKIVL